MENLNFKRPPPPFCHLPPPPGVPVGPSFFNFPPPPMGQPPINWPMNNALEFNKPFDNFNQNVERNIYNNFDLPPPSNIAVRRTSDDVWIKNWTKSVNNKLKSGFTDEKRTTGICVKISVFKEKLKKFAIGIKDLESLSNCLSVLKKSLSDEEWNERCKEIEEKRVYLKTLMDEITREQPDVEKLVKKRKKKRLRQKLKKEDRHKQLVETRIHREREHKRIDMWLEKMKEEVERTKREEQVKLEADVVLSEVTQKKTEAKRTLSLLNNLSKLRSARVQSLKARGGHISLSEIETFNQVFEKLKKYWVDQLKEYNMEEQGLRVMLNDAELKRSNVELSLKKEILQQWGHIIFGCSLDKPSLFEPASIEQLISVRFAWDKYVCSDDMVMASNIPIGWVIPLGPTSQDWAKLLKP